MFQIISLSVFNKSKTHRPIGAIQSLLLNSGFQISASCVWNDVVFLGFAVSKAAQFDPTSSFPDFLNLKVISLLFLMKISGISLTRGAGCTLPTT